MFFGMWKEKKITGVIVIGIGLFILSGGIVCWVIGTNLPNFYTSNFLISLPVQPISDDNYGYWEVSYNNSDNKTITNLNLQLDESFLDHSLKGMKFIFLHNLFGYDIDSYLYDNNNRRICTFIHNYNDFIGNITINNSIVYETMASYPQNSQINNYYRVKCPYPTLITRKNNISESCKRKSGSFMKMPGNFTTTLICEADLSEAEFPLYLQINKFKIVTKDFIHTPQLYLAVWKKSESLPLTITGSVVTSVGMAFVIAALIIFFSMIFDQQG